MPEESWEGGEVKEKVDFQWVLSRQLDRIGRMSLDFKHSDEMDYAIDILGTFIEPYAEDGWSKEVGKLKGARDKDEDEYHRNSNPSLLVHILKLMRKRKLLGKELEELEF